MPSSELHSHRQLRVLVVAHNAVAASNRRRVDALAELPDTQVALLTPPWWYEEGRRIQVEPSAGWYVGSTLATGNGTRYIYRAQLLGLIRRWQPDVIDVHEEPFSLAALQVLLAREALARHAALVFYSAVNVVRRWRLPYRLAEQVVLARADGAYVPSHAVPGVLRAKGYAGPLEVIPLGVDLQCFSTASAMELGGCIPRPRVGFLGRLEPVKGLDVLLQAVPSFHGVARVLIAGAGPEKNRLLRLVAERGLKERVFFIGEVAYEEVPGFLKALDVLVLPSVTLLPLHREQFGRVLVEAMAAGLPVVGSSSGAIPEVIGDAGLVVPEGDPCALAAALNRLLVDADLRQTLAERGRERAASQYAWPVVAARTRALYLRAVAHRAEKHLQGRTRAG
jgi:glycosyltransferase involved in cell wall biosynthesis